MPLLSSPILFKEENLSTASACLTIDLAALRSNYRLLKERAAGAAVAGIVKANAYGLGMAEIVSVLESEGCPHYFVATLDEALALRHLTTKPIAMLGGLWAGCEAEYGQHDITPVLNTLDEIARWQAQVRKMERTLPAILHFDTGMNRLGLTADETAILLEAPTRFEGLVLPMVMSHFACADEKNHPMNNKQFRRFQTIAAHFPQAQKSLANSSGLFRSSDYAFDFVRPGIALYGGNPMLESENPMQPVVRLDARILQVKTVKKNETIGYNATYRFENTARVATVALGYADGFFRGHVNKAALYYKGQPCPVIGRVSMDLVNIDMGDLCPVPGETLEVLGAHQTIDDLAKTAGTISYKILTALGPRFKRFYV